jgi:hypothetical protein
MTPPSPELMAEKLEGHIFTEAMRWKKHGAWRTIFIQELIAAALHEYGEACYHEGRLKGFDEACKIVRES